MSADHAVKSRGYLDQMRPAVQPQLRSRLARCGSALFHALGVTMKSSAFATIILLLIAGPALAGRYKQPGENEPHANLRFSSAQSGIKSLQMYWAFSDPLCTQAGEIITWVNWAKRKEQLSRVRTSAKLNLVATYQEITGISRTAGALGHTADHCNSVGSFTPEDGRTYRITQPTDLAACRVAVVDESTGIAPPDFQLVETQEKCDFKVL